MSLGMTLFDASWQQLARFLQDSAQGGIGFIGLGVAGKLLLMEGVIRRRLPLSVARRSGSLGALGTLGIV